MLLCPVRDCREELIRDQRRVFCGRGHSFDVARSGYLNLLQPQDKKSKQPGDSAAAVNGRRHLHGLGVTAPLLEAIAELAAPSASDAVLDAGCGEGFYLGSMAGRFGFSGHGVDISIPAIDAAARRYPGCEWVVANADRFIPYRAGSFSLILSITARMNPAEFGRVLRSGGRLLVAVPAPGDLIELRGDARERAGRTAETFAEGFTMIDQRRVTTSAELDADTVRGLLHSIYRPPNSRQPEAMRVTFSLDLLLFRA